MTTSRIAHALVWLLNALAAAAFAADGPLPGVRHILKASADDAVYCSLLAPVTWQLELSHDEQTQRDRFLFHPPNAVYPYLMVDARRAPDGELDREWERARRLPQHALLDEDAPAHCFDSVRSAIWQIEQDERLLTIRAQLLRDPMLTLQFTGVQPVDPAEPETLLKVIDTIDFDGSRSQSQAAATPVPASAARTQPKFLLLTESESLPGPGLKYWIAGLVAGALLTLVVVERTLRRRDEAQRISAAEDAARERQRAQRELDEWTPSPRHPKRRPKPRARPKPD